MSTIAIRIEPLSVPRLEDLGQGLVDVGDTTPIRAAPERREGNVTPPSPGESEPLLESFARNRGYRRVATSCLPLQSSGKVVRQAQGCARHTCVLFPEYSPVHGLEDRGIHPYHEEDAEDQGREGLGGFAADAPLVGLAALIAATSAVNP